MGLFSNAVPKRKWGDLIITLGSHLLADGDSWFATFQRWAVDHNVALKESTLTPTAKKHISMLQLSAVSATLQENGYVTNTADAIFLMEGIYAVLTKNPPPELHKDIASDMFMFANDAQSSLASWAEVMARETSYSPRAVTEALSGFATQLVVKAKIDTCLACGDPKSGAKIAGLLHK